MKRVTFRKPPSETGGKKFNILFLSSLLLIVSAAFLIPENGKQDRPDENNGKYKILEKLERGVAVSREEIVSAFSSGSDIFEEPEMLDPELDRFIQGLRYDFTLVEEEKEMQIEIMRKELERLTGEMRKLKQELSYSFEEILI